MVNLCCDQALIDFVNKAKCLDHILVVMDGFFVYKHCKLFPHGCESLSGGFCKI